MTSESTAAFLARRNVRVRRFQSQFLMKVVVGLDFRTKLIGRDGAAARRQSGIIHGTHVYD